MLAVMGVVRQTMLGEERTMGKGTSMVERKVAVSVLFHKISLSLERLETCGRCGEFLNRQLSRL
jgi:hypothetical protein